MDRRACSECEGEQHCCRYHLAGDSVLGYANPASEFLALHDRAVTSTGYVWIATARQYQRASNCVMRTSRVLGKTARISNRPPSTLPRTPTAYSNRLPNRSVLCSIFDTYVGGIDNTPIGLSALQFSTGAGNIDIGSGAGSKVTSGSDNVEIANDGNSNDSGVIRIGTGNQTSTFIAGISGVTVIGAAALVNSQRPARRAILFDPIHVRCTRSGRRQRRPDATAANQVSLQAGGSRWQRTVTVRTWLRGRSGVSRARCAEQRWPDRLRAVSAASSHAAE